MSEVRLVLRDANETRSGTVHGSQIEVYVAALSCDPTTLAELNAAIDRFALESPDKGHFAWFSKELNDEPWDAGLVVIDLAAKLVVQESTYTWYGHGGHVEHRASENREGQAIGYGVTNEWHFLTRALDWNACADRRRREFAANPPIDVREVVYGEVMMSFMVRECVSEFRRRDEIRKQVHAEMIDRRQQWIENYAKKPQPEPTTQTLEELASPSEGQPLFERVFYDTIRDIHARWLLAPCSNLNGDTPREAMRRFRSHISNDMRSREYQWQVNEECPPGLSPESHAFQFGGFGTNELVMHYDYVREILWACWSRLEEMSSEQFEAIDIEAHVAGELPRLREVGELWLNSPWEETPHKTPRQIIDRERARLPDGGSYVPIDPDCPCCQAMAEMPGIGFWHLDGSGMDDIFAFSLYHETVEDWQKEQDEYEAQSRAFDAQQKLKQEWNLPSEFSGLPDDADDIWRIAFETPEGELPLGHRLLVVANRMADLIVAIRISAGEDPTIPAEAITTEIGRCYKRLRSACIEVNAQNYEEFLGPLIDNFVEVTEKIGFNRATIRNAEQLSDALHGFQRPSTNYPSDWLDGDVPF